MFTSWEKTLKLKGSNSSLGISSSPEDVSNSHSRAIVSQQSPPAPNITGMAAWPTYENSWPWSLHSRTCHHLKTLQTPLFVLPNKYRVRSGLLSRLMIQRVASRPSETRKQMSWVWPSDPGSHLSDTTLQLLDLRKDVWSKFSLDL